MGKVLSTILMAVVTVLFCFCTVFLPPIGDVNSAPNQHVTPHYIEHAKEDTGSPNIVTATLADYRGFDTLWETSVMFVSGLTACLILMVNTEEGKKVLKKGKKEKGGAKNGQ